MSLDKIVILKLEQKNAELLAKVERLHGLNMGLAGAQLELAELRAELELLRELEEKAREEHDLPPNPTNECDTCVTLRRLDELRERAATQVLPFEKKKEGA